jgi:hypothetical protein
MAEGFVTLRTGGARGVVRRSWLGSRKLTQDRAGMHLAAD